MKKTILKAALASLVLAAPAVVFASGGLVGDCYDCHTMHNSEQNAPVAQIGGVVTGEPIQNLLRLDCVSCHANTPTGGAKLWTMTGGSIVPQVMHGGGTDLAGGNWRYMLDDSSNRKGHNVVDLKTQYGGLEESYPNATSDPVYQPPGLDEQDGGPHHSNPNFTEVAPFDKFTCAGAKGCHGTRSQLLSGETIDNGTDNNFTNAVRRTGIAAISGSHHNNYDGQKDGENYPRDETAFHDGQRVADGYRFITGLKGYGNESERWQNNSSTSHNEYYGKADGIENTGTSGCHRCHIEGHAGGLSSRAAFNSTITTPNNTMSGFCASCHGAFHSSGGAGTNADMMHEPSNGVSGAFLRHPSDYTIPASGEYAAYQTYDITAPVARPTLASATSETVTPGTDLVMCLSCHVAHASANDYLLRFDYTNMTAGGFGSIAAAQSAGGCLACHTTKGVLPEMR